MLLALIPLFVRMGFIHPVLLYGTNNVQTDGLSMADINRRSVGARLVLGGRIAEGRKEKTVAGMIERLR